MLHAVIIDDEYNGVRGLELLIQKFIPEVKVVASTTNPVEGIELVTNYRPEIVFLDINMPVLNGFQLLDNLESRKFHLIFTTAYREHGLKALKQNALDYLLKPINIEDLNQAILRVKQRQNQQWETPMIENLLQSLNPELHNKIPFPTRTTIELVKPENVVFIEASSNSSKAFLCGNECLEVTKPLKDYNAMLCGKDRRFMRIHNSFIINLHHVSRFIKGDCSFVVMNNHKTIPVSKHRKDDLLGYFNYSVAE